MTEETEETESHAINNVLQVFSQDETKLVAMTSFDGGDTSEEFMDNYDFSLKKLITMTEFSELKESKERYLPHAVFGRSKTPEVWQQFVETDLIHYKNEVNDKTYVIVRCFEAETDEDGESGPYTPVHVDVEDHIKLPQVIKMSKYED
jgi:hypothetical protein